MVIGQVGRSCKNALSDEFSDARGGKDVLVHRSKIDAVEGLRLFRWGSHRARPRRTAAGLPRGEFIG